MQSGLKLGSFVREEVYGIVGMRALLNGVRMLTFNILRKHQKLDAFLGSFCSFVYFIFLPTALISFFLQSVASSRKTVVFTTYRRWWLPFL